MVALAVSITACVSTTPSSGDAPLVPEEAFTPDRPDELAIGRVIGVTDGDSVDIELASGALIEVRLIGVNAPERGECYAAEARDFLAQTIGGEEVGVDLVDEDQFGRRLANVWIGDDLINLTLVAGGFAIAQTPDDANPHGAIIVDAEEIAFQDGVGLWSPSACGATDDVPSIQFDGDSAQYNPDGPDDTELDSEYVVLENTGDVAIDLSGWVLRDESSRNRLEIPSGTAIEPGMQVTVSSGCGTEVSWCQGRPIWNNGGDMALLSDRNGRVIARDRY